MDADVLDQLVLAQAPLHLGFQEGVLIPEQIAGAFEFQLGAHPGEHDGRLERLGDVVDGAQSEAPLLVARGIHGGDEDHGNVAGKRIDAQVLEHLEAIHARHHDVEQDQVGSGLAGGDLQGARAGVGSQDAASRLQQFAKNGQVLRVVVDNEDGRVLHGLGRR
jgi:hypothetical protein